MVREQQCKKKGLKDKNKKFLENKNFFFAMLEVEFNDQYGEAQGR
jgi:hypothetical protein